MQQQALRLAAPALAQNPAIAEKDIRALLRRSTYLGRRQDALSVAARPGHPDRARLLKQLREYAPA